MEKQLKEYVEHLEGKVEGENYELKEVYEQLLKSGRLATIGELPVIAVHRTMMSLARRASF